MGDFEPKVKKIISLNEVLESDIDFSIEKINTGDDSERQFYIRAFLRAYASWIEGTLFMHKKIIRDCEAGWYKALPTAYQLYMFESDWTISESGKPKILDKKLKTLSNLKAFFVVAGELFPLYKVDYSKRGWGCVREFYDFRDSMMHPDDTNLVNLSPDQLRNCEQGRLWLKAEFKLVRDAMMERL